MNAESGEGRARTLVAKTSFVARVDGILSERRLHRVSLFGLCGIWTHGEVYIWCAFSTNEEV